MATLDFNYDTRVITVQSPDVQITIQELLNLIATEKATSLSMDDLLFIGGAGGDTGASIGYGEIARWEGKASLGQPGEFGGIYLTLLGWKLDFAEFVASGPLETLVIGGVLLALDIEGLSVNPIVSTVNVCTIAQAASATFSEAQANKQLQYQIESLQIETHRQTGDTYYVDPTNGSDLNDGLLPERPSPGSLRGPKMTFASAFALVQSGHHDGIYFVQSNVGAPSILDEILVINKEDVQIRGPGPGFQIRSTAAGTVPVTISGDHVEFSGVSILPPVGGGLAGIMTSGEEPYLHNLSISGSTGVGVVLGAGSDHFIMSNVAIDNCVGTGLEIQAAVDGRVSGGRIHDCDIGIYLNALGGTVDGQVELADIIIYDHVTKGLRIDAGFEATFIKPTVVFTQNGSGQVDGTSPAHDVENNEPSTEFLIRPKDVAEKVDRNQDIIESHFENPSSQAVHFWVNPGAGGSDNWDGSRAAPFKTINYALSQCVSGRHDAIHLFCDVSAVIFDEQVVITKDFITLSGSGNGIQVRSTSPGDVITCSARGVSMRNFHVQGHTSGSGHGIVTTGDGVRINHVRIERAQGDGFRITDCSDLRMNDVSFDEGGIVGDGIVIDGATVATRFHQIKNSRILGCGGSGIRLTGSFLASCNVQDNIIHGNGAYGVDIEAGVTDCTILDNHLGGNATNPVRNLGTNNHFQNNEQWAKQEALRGYVVIDPANGIAGTQYPVGTSEVPVNNITDAKILAAARGLTTFRVVGTLVVGASDDISGYAFEGTNPLVEIMVLLAGCTTEATAFTDLILTGAFGGGVVCTRVGMSSVSNIGSDNGPSLFNECILLESTISFQAGLATPQKVSFISCLAGAATGSGSILDFNGTAQTIAFRKLGGDFVVRNLTHASGAVDLGFSHGHVTVEASCTDGTLELEGIGQYTDNSAGTAVDTTGLLDPSNLATVSNVQLILKHMRNRLEVDLTAQELIMYDDDGTTVLQRWPLETDAGGNVTTQVGVQTKRLAPLL